MHDPADGDAPLAERSAILLGVGAILLVSPLRLAWMREDAPWPLPFAVWLGLVALAALAARRPSR